MKQYVKEFANDELKKPHHEKVKEYINNTVRSYEKGLITSYEAIRSIVNLIEKVAN